MKAIVILPNKKPIEMEAKKEGGRWVVGGDIANWVTDLGGEIYIVNTAKNATYKLVGNRLNYCDTAEAFNI